MVAITTAEILMVMTLFGVTLLIQRSDMKPVNQKATLMEEVMQISADMTKH